MANAEAAVPKRRPFAVHPPLIALFPVLAIYSANTGLFPLHDLLQPCLWALAGGAGLWLVFGLLRRSAEQGAWMATFVIAATWASHKGFPHLSLWVCWLLIFAGFCVGTWLAARHRMATGQMNVFSVLLVLVSSFGILKAQSPSHPVSLDKVAVASPATKPDIYVLLLDGYGRDDQLKRVLSFDNQDFVSQLRKDGFRVLTQNHSNYVQTALSVSSMLNLDYLQTLLPKVSSQETSRNAAIDLVNRPRVVRDLRAAGYESIAISTGFPSFEFEGFDLRIADPPPVTYFESILLDSLPLPPNKGVIESQYTARRRMLQHSFQSLEGLAVRTARPRFIFAHILCPHPPFVFDGEAERPATKSGFSYFDGSDYMAFVGTSQTYREGYTGQVRWLNERLKSFVSKLLAQPGPKPIILLQGDHGSKLHLDQNLLEKTDLNEAMSPLAAYLLPSNVEEEIGESTTPVNVMRAVVSYATGEDLKPLPDRSYYSPFSHPFDFHEVSPR